MNCVLTSKCQELSKVTHAEGCLLTLIGSVVQILNVRLAVFLSSAVIINNSNI